MAPQNDDYTIGEVARRLERMGTSLDAIHAKLDTRPDAEFIAVLEKGHSDTHARQDKDIQTLQDGQTWIMRTALAAMGMVVASIVGSVVVALVGA